MVGCKRLLAADFVMSFMWVWSSVLIKILVLIILGYGAHDVRGDIVRYGVYILNMFFFAFFSKLTGGGSYNALSILSAAITGDFSNFIFTIGARIPAQVLGSVYAVRFILNTFPGIKHEPRLHMDMAKGALTEGFLTFSMVVISLGLVRKINDNFFIKTWISSVSKLILHMLGSDITGGYMNPVSVVGWAFAYGEHISKEHIIVYWLAPIEATLAAVWVTRILVQPEKEGSASPKNDDSPKPKMD